MNLDIKTLRSYRVAKVAMVDVVAGAIGMVLIFLYFKPRDKPALPFVVAGVALTIPIGIVFHVLFGTKTALNYKLGLSDAPESS
jgi:hypothetical protein